VLCGTDTHLALAFAGFLWLAVVGFLQRGFSKLLSIKWGLPVKKVEKMNELKNNSTKIN
jgi:hypothetical protein